MKSNRESKGCCLNNLSKRVINLANNNYPWFPIIFSDKCDGCAKTGKPRCVEFCPNGVFTFLEGKAVVTYPAKCGGGYSTLRCSACAPLCHKRAISFPSKNSAFSQVVQDNKDLIRKTICKVCGKSFWTNREDDVCFDYEK